MCNIIRDDDAACDYDNFPLRELRADANTSADFLFYADENRLTSRKIERFNDEGLTF